MSMTTPNGATAAPTSNGADSAAHLGLVRTADIIQEMQTAYLDYAMSVIVARALPDVRDGLKPVHRRILYAMWHDLSLTSDKPHKKSARIVGEVLGKYHPHGDSAIYDAMVRMAQSFSLRYPLIDGQGNFGSIDGDNAAAMRYTEARLASISNLMLDDLDKDTVEWGNNFDNTLREPNVLPASLPNLLINGSSGIAVGMATNIPPHNLGEVVDALTYVIDHYQTMDEITIEQLLEFIKGPDFPTGGIVYRFRAEGKDEDHTDAIVQGYSLGKSRLVMQAKAHFEEMSRGRMRILITELPYQTSKTSIIERIADLVRDGKIEGIGDLRDESDRTGMRVVIELTRGADPKAVLADLFKYTPLQQTFGMQLLALVDGQPRMLNLKRILQLFIQHRQEIIRRRSEFDLARARERAHIVEGLLRALDILDEVIHTIRHSQSADSARKNLVTNFKFSEIQAQAILDMQLRRLAALERKKLKDEYDELKRLIAYLEDLLAHPEKVLALIKSDLLAIKEKYGDARRTQIVDRTKGALTTTDLLPDQTVWVAVSDEGELRRHGVVKLTHSSLRQAARGSEVALLTANTRDLLYLFTKDGRCGRVAIHEIPPDGAAKHLAELCGFTRRDKVTAALALPRPDGEAPPGSLFFATEQGMVKRVSLADVTSLTSEAAVMNVDDKDRLIAAFCTRGDQEVILATADGQSIRFGEEDVRSMGLTAGGVGGVKLGKGDKVVFAGVVVPDGALLTVTGLGFAKRSPLGDYSRQGRNGGGIVTHKLSAKTGKVTAATVIPGKNPPHWLAALRAKDGALTVALDEVPVMGRGVLGKQITDATGSAAVTALRWVTGPVGGEPAEEPPTVGPATKRVDKPKEKPTSQTAATQPKPQVAQPPLRMVEAAPGPRVVAPDGKKTGKAADAPKPQEKTVAQEAPVKMAAKPSAARTQTADKPLPVATKSAPATATPPGQAGLFDGEFAAATTAATTKSDKLQTVVSVKKKPAQPK